VVPHFALESLRPRPFDPSAQVSFKPREDQCPINRPAGESWRVPAYHRRGISKPGETTYAFDALQRATVRGTLGGRGALDVAIIASATQ